MQEDIKEILNFVFIESKHFTVTMVDVLEVFFIFLIGRILSYLLKRYLRRRTKQKTLDEGKAHAIGQIATYFIYTIAFILALDSIGVRITVLLAGSTALFVGLGLGLQDAFKDFASGIILLSERSIAAKDIVEVDSTVSVVEEIGLRTTKVRTRNGIEMIIPNQMLTSNKIINWSHNEKTARFAVSVGVAYGSDTNKVKQFLLEIAHSHEAILTSPKPFVFFKDFGSSSLDFELLFYSNNLFGIERVKSELRFEIDQKFRENNISIAFPQLDVWFKNKLNIENLKP